MFSPVLALGFGLDFYAFYVFHGSFIKVSLLAACPVSAKFFLLPWVLRSSGKCAGITFLPDLEPALALGAGFGVCCTAQSWLDFASLESGQRDRGSLFKVMV